MAFKKKVVEAVEPIETVQEIMDTVKITEPTESKVSSKKFYVYDSKFNIHSFVTSIEEAISESEKIDGSYKEIK